jgi:flagellar protein FliS
MPTPTPNAYLQTKVLTASPGELRLMLLDGSIRFARQGREGLERRDYEAAYRGVTRCQDIVLELINALRPEQQPDLCRQVAALYTYIFRRLVEGLRVRDPAVLEEVIRLLEYERETWAMALRRLAEESAGAAPTAVSEGPGGVSVCA